MNSNSYKIAVNTRALLRGRLDGIGWFTYHILRQWVTNNPQHTFYFIFDRPYDSSFVFSSNVVPIVVPPPARHPFLWYIWYEWMVPRALDKIDPDIFISMDTYTSVRWKGKKMTAIHDIAFTLFDGQVYPFAQKFLRYFTPKYIGISDKIITVSESTKRDLMDYYGCPEDKIIISHNAPSPMYKPLSPKEIIDFKMENTGGKDFFLFVGSIQPRKNVLRLLQAFEYYRAHFPSKHKLVIIGRLSWKYDDIVEFHDSMRYKNEVVFISHSSPDIISRWMASSTALMMVSIYEGFGVPIVEAMSSDVPIICSNISSMPEVAGNAAILVSPDDVQDIAQAMNRIATDDILRDGLIKNGREQVKKYTWEDAADIIWQQITWLIG